MCLNSAGEHAAPHTRQVSGGIRAAAPGVGGGYGGRAAGPRHPLARTARAATRANRHLRDLRLTRELCIKFCLDMTSCISSKGHLF